MPALATIAAAYQVLKQHGYSTEQVGRLEYEGYLRLFNRIPSPVQETPDDPPSGSPPPPPALPPSTPRGIQTRSTTPFTPSPWCLINTPSGAWGITSPSAKSGFAPPATKKPGGSHSRPCAPVWALRCPTRTRSA
jgi:hypothetical protein